MLIVTYKYNSGWNDKLIHAEIPGHYRTGAYPAM